MLKSTSFSSIDESTLLIDNSTLKIWVIGDETDPRLARTLFTPANILAPISPVITLHSIEVREEKVICTYVVDSHSSFGKLDLMRAASVFDATKASFGLSGVCRGANNKYFLGSLVINKFLELYCPVGDAGENVIVVEFGYESDNFLSKSPSV